MFNKAENISQDLKRLEKFLLFLFLRTLEYLYQYLSKQVTFDEEAKKFHFILGFTATYLIIIFLIKTFEYCVFLVYLQII